MRKYIFSDEAGCLEFSRKKNVSKYFIACAVSLDSCEVGLELLKLRRALLWEGHDLGSYFHCTKDRQVVRDRVFELIERTELRVHAQIMEKSKAQPQIRSSRERFYKHGWYYLFKFVAPRLVRADDELMVTTASIGTQKSQAAFSAAVNDVVQQTIKVPAANCRTVFCSAASDPCLQVADYCTWAIQRKWESGGEDVRSYNRIKSKVAYEFDLWARGSTHYY